MDKEIWTKAKSDSLGLSNYFESNIGKYQWKKRFDVTIFSSTNKSSIEKTQRFLKNGKSIAYIKEKLNTNGKINIVEKSGLFEEDFDVLSEYKALSKGISNIITKDGYYFVVEVLSVKEPEAKLLSECKGKVVSDYQQYLEDTWINELKKEFDIKINKDVFQNIKQQVKR